MTLAELSLKRPVTAIMFFVSMTVIGLIAAFRLPLEGMPDIQFPFMMVNIQYPGSTPSEVERTITRPVEDALATLPGIEHMRSVSSADGVQVFMQLKWGENTAVKAVQAREKIDAIRDELPSDLQRFQVMKFSTSDQPMLQLRISSKRDLSNAYELLDRKLKRPLERIPGVAQVQIQGIAPPEVLIDVSADRLNAAGVSLNDVYERLKQANFSASAGKVDQGTMRYQVQPVGEWRSLDDIRSMPLNDKGLKLGDVADISLSPAVLDYARQLDMHPAIAVDISRERSANLVAVAGRIAAELNKITRDPAMRGITLYRLGDEASAITSSLSELGQAGGIGILLSIFVLFFFLRDWASTMMVALAIPICMVITLGCMYFFGMTLNMLSLMGLLLAVGMLVDNAVVVVESIYQYREKFPDQPWYCAVQGTQVVGIAIAAGTFTSIVVFLPIVLGHRDGVSVYLTQVAVTMAIAHLSSWLVAVSLIPMLSTRLASPKFIGRKTIVSRLQDRYTKLVGWTLRYRGRTMFGLLLLLALSIVPMAMTKTDMFPPNDSGQLYLRYDLNGVYRLGEMKKSIDVVEQWLNAHRKQLDLEHIYSYYNEQGDANTTLMLDPDRKHDSQQIMETIRKGLPKIPIGKVSFDNQSQSDNGVQLYLHGDSSAMLRELSAPVIKALQRIPGLRDVHPSEEGSDRELSIHVDRDRALQYGFSASDVAQYISVALRGVQLREFHQDGTQIPVWLRFNKADISDVQDLNDYKLQRADGTQVPLMALVHVNDRGSPNSIERDSRQTSMQIVANLAPGKTLDEVKQKIESQLNALQYPAGYGWSFGQNFDQDRKAGQNMLFNTLIALLLVYVVMCAMFESLIYPAAILTTFIFSIFGVYWLFWITGTTFSIMASIGVLILMGVVVNNGIVMIVHINQLRHSGKLRMDAVASGARERLRPILMTMGTAILGMVPLCIGDASIGGDGPSYYPMARAIAGGLIFSTLVSLLWLPAIYTLLDDARNWTRTVWGDAKNSRFPALRRATEGRS